MNLHPGARVHIVGCAGAGMSGVARFLHDYGCVVSGCDAAIGESADDLIREGIAITLDTDPLAGDDADVVLWSPAVPLTHPVLLRARDRGATLLARSELLGQLGGLFDVVGLTGTHGKTTATSMMVHVMAAAGRDDSWLVGADVRGVGKNGHAGSSSTLLLETDESYGTFALLRPFALGVLNVEADHLDHYGDLATLEAAFVNLIERTTGPVVAWIDDAGAARVASMVHRDVLTVGTSDHAQWRVIESQLHRRSATFTLQGDRSVAITLRVTGAHNVANAAVVAVLALTLGVDESAVVAGLEAFRGAPRRFEFRGTYRDFDVYEDYAHLPAEIAATLEAARAAGYQRIVAVFQPHRFSRTHAVGVAFAPAFDLADEVIVTDIYASGEENVHSVSGADVADAIQSHRDHEVRYAATKDEVLDALTLADGDALFFIGAGDVGQWADDVVTA